MKRVEKIPRKYDLAKIYSSKRWMFILDKNLDELENDKLNSYIEDINKDTKRLSDKPEQYRSYLKEIEPIKKKFDLKFTELINFYEKKLIRESRVVKLKEFFFFDREYVEYDIYFSTETIEDEFFNLYNQVLDLFEKDLYLFKKSGFTGYPYLFPKEFTHNSVKYWSNLFYKSLIGIKDIEKFTELVREKYMSHHSFDPEASTLRTTKFLEKLYKIGVERNLLSKRVPNLPEVSYVKWYFEKIIEENDRLKRRIELILRSRKRAVELAKNSNFVYIMSSEDLPKDSYKIGWTSNLPEERAEELSGTSVLHDYKVEYATKFKDAENVEKTIHKHFKEFRIRKNKEIFNVKLEEIIKYIENLKKNT